MERPSRAGWALAALCLALLPASLCAQTWINDAPYYPWTYQITTVQTFNDINLSANEIASILPLIVDLRDAEQCYYGDMAIVYREDFVRGTGYKSDYPREITVDKAKARYFAHRDKIWNTITVRVGADKCNRIRGLCEARSYRVEPVLSERVQRIDTLLAQWDTQAKARIAAYGGTPAVTITETTTTVTEPAGFAHRSDADMGYNLTYVTSAPITTADLCNLMQQRLVAYAFGPRVFEAYWWTDRDLTAEDLWMLQHMRFGIWK